jgi:hypothetical protein
MPYHLFLLLSCPCLPCLVHILFYVVASSSLLALLSVCRVKDCVCECLPHQQVYGLSMVLLHGLQHELNLCVSVEKSEVKVKCILLTAPRCNILVSETKSQFMYAPAVDSKESGAPLPSLQVCYAGKVVWCQHITTEREHDVISHKYAKACRCGVGCCEGLKLCLLRHKIFPPGFTPVTS